MKKIQLRHTLLQDFLNSCNEKLVQDPGNTELLSTRALLFNLSLNYQKGIDDLNAILERCPDDSDLYMLRADCFLNLQDFTHAKHDYLRALKRRNPVELAAMVEDFIIRETISDDEELQEMSQVILYEKQNIVLKLLPGFVES